MKRLLSAALITALMGGGCAGAPDDTPLQTEELGEANQPLRLCSYLGVAGQNGAHTWDLPHFCRESGLGGYSCYFPGWAENPANSITWGWAPGASSACTGDYPGQLNGVKITNLDVDIQQAFDSWENATGFNFEKAASGTTPAISLTCAASQNAKALATNYVLPPYVKNHQVVLWGDIIAYAGVAGVPLSVPNQTEASAFYTYAKGEIVFHDKKLMEDVINTSCTVVTTVAKMKRRHRQLVATTVQHEVGHLLGFGHASTGLMKVEPDCNLDLGSGDSVSLRTIPDYAKEALNTLHTGWDKGMLDPGDPGGGDFGQPPWTPNSAFDCGVSVPAEQGQHKASFGGSATDEATATRQDALDLGRDTLLPPPSAPHPVMDPPPEPAPAWVPPINVDLGYRANFSDEWTYGVQVGDRHLPCNWKTDTQTCLVPSGTFIHWCFEPTVTSQRKSQLRDPFPWNDEFPGATWPANPLSQNRYPFGGFWLVYHASCNDAGVELVIDDHAVGASGGTYMHDYVRVDFPEANENNRLEVVQNMPWPIPGKYYNWGKDGASDRTWALMHIDLDDAGTHGVTNGDHWRITQNAIRLGLLWVTGIGSRKDRNDVMSSLRVLPYEKNTLMDQFFSQPAVETNFHDNLGFTQPEHCRHMYYNSHGISIGAFVLDYYCGWDSAIGSLSTPN